MRSPTRRIGRGASGARRRATCGDRTAPRRVRRACSVTGDDRELGLDRNITRRDFLDGVAIAIGGAVVGPHALHAASARRGAGRAAMRDGTYPPALTGLRGSHVGSFEALHALRDGTFWKHAKAPVPTHEEYDLIVVGAGISGLAAAHYFRANRPGAKVLILDNHDDFGGHAKRNEFIYAGETHIGYGGTQSIDSPSPYSPVAKALIAELGIDVASYGKALDSALYLSLGLKPGFFFDAATFGADRLVVGDPRAADPAALAASPLSATARHDLERLTTERLDPFPGLSVAVKKAKLARMSYADFLTHVWKVDPAVVRLYRKVPHPLFGAGIDVVPAQDAYGLGLPGFQGMGLDDVPGPGQNWDSRKSEEAESYYFHFPDGNATIARLLVRSLIPTAIPGSTAADVVTARADYARLDEAGSDVRIRLGSPVMRVRHLGAPAKAKRVEVTYLQNGTLRSATGGAVVLACWHQVIPYICPELPTAQKTAMTFETKVPLVYTNVLIRDWTAFQRLGVRSVATPGLWHDSVSLDMPVSVGSYRHPRSPTQPIVLHLNKSLAKPGLPIRMQHLAGRTELYTTPFDTIERNVRGDLLRVLGAGGFDPARDILGLTVNRWPHGYAYQYNSLFDDFWFEGAETPCEVARRPFGRLAVANADAGAYSYTDAAIDHGHRAVQEILRLDP
ncbi:MAG: NAD(P)-binding protein [Gemmatimonadetes bacterium]|nr:NAD(P)-binding protein [Gemmatimonadota bacterium]